MGKKVRSIVEEGGLSRWGANKGLSLMASQKVRKRHSIQGSIPDRERKIKRLQRISPVRPDAYLPPARRRSVSKG